MDRFVCILIAVSVIFILTYKPESKTLEKYVSPAASSPQQASPQPECCGSDAYRANHHTQCESAYYQNLQFGQPKEEMGCPTRQPNVLMGAIVEPAQYNI
jgi:hypothetical protein